MQELWAKRDREKEREAERPARSRLALRAGGGGPRRGGALANEADSPLRRAAIEALARGSAT
jgi:hypothetical protein